jgi:lipopolysaccharide transport system permease protein
MSDVLKEEKVEVGVVRIESRGGWLRMNWGELWSYREMLYFLTWRDIKVRYKQTVLGATWAVLQPVMAMVVFTIFFGKLAGIKTDGIPQPIFFFSGLLPWTFFSGVVTNSANSLIGNERLVTKIYFPRLLLPAASVGVGLVDLAISLVVLGGMMVYYGYGVSGGIFLLPMLLVLNILAGLGVGLLLSALNVEYRDFKYVIPFMIQLWMFATPVVYPASLVPAAYRSWYALNPMTGLIEGFRASMLGRPIPWSLLGISAVVGVGMFFGGVTYFRRAEWKFADAI